MDSTEIEVDGKAETIKSTAEHPYYVLNAAADRKVINFEGKEYNIESTERWIAAKDLEVGDKVLLSSGNTGIISKLEIEHLAESETTYNFEVADFHTYYVGENGVCVHNAACDWKWGEGSFDSVDDSLAYHVKEHGAKLGLDPKDTAGYLKKAQNFAETVAQRGVRASHLVDGATPNIYRYFYNGKYIDLDKIGKIIVSFG